MIFMIFQVLYFIGNCMYKKFHQKMKSIKEKKIDESKELSDKQEKKIINCFESDDSYENETPTIRFHPPAYIQRYNAVRNVLESDRYIGKIRKIVEFGCSELNFVVHMKNISTVEEIICVDIDREVLEMHKGKVEPLHADYLHERSRPLTIDIYEGSVTQNDQVLANADAVVCIELIEHLYPDTLKDLPANIFGYMTPKVVIMTTPNAEFNVLFKNLVGFRHPDHKFEWTRKEFQDWAHEITRSYPNYEVTFHGICNGPKEMEHLGACSQMAVFHQLTEVDKSCSTMEGVVSLYKLVDRQEYPYKIDSRSDEEKILDDAVFYIRNFSSGNSSLEEEVPLELIRKSIRRYSITEETLRDVLQQNGWVIEQREHGAVILVPPPSTFSEQSLYKDDEDNFFDENWTENHDQDDWDFHPGPPVNFSQETCNRFNCNVENAYQENWDDDSDITVPMNIAKSSEKTENCRVNGNTEEPIPSNFTNNCGVLDEYPSMCSVYLEKTQEGTKMASPTSTLSLLNEDEGTTPVIRKRGFNEQCYLENSELKKLENGLNHHSQHTSTMKKQRSRENNIETNQNKRTQFELVRGSKNEESDQEAVMKDINDSIIDAMLISKNTKEETTAVSIPKKTSTMLECSECSENKIFSLNNSGTTSISYSPDHIDSGYPNSTLAVDISPECDLSSIIDSESSIAEALIPDLLEVIEVENGDFANNNRNDGRDNMFAEDEHDIEHDLQPLINVLENDIENENDIYMLQNGFPIWLLGILEMADPVAAEIERADQENPFIYGPNFDLAAGEI